MPSNFILKLILNIYPQYAPQMGCFISKTSKHCSVRFYKKTVPWNQFKNDDCLLNIRKSFLL